MSIARGSSVNRLAMGRAAGKTRDSSCSCETAGAADDADDGRDADGDTHGALAPAEVAALCSLRACSDSAGRLQQRGSSREIADMCRRAVSATMGSISSPLMGSTCARHRLASRAKAGAGPGCWGCCCRCCAPASAVLLLLVRPVAGVASMSVMLCALPSAILPPSISSYRSKSSRLPCVTLPLLVLLLVLESESKPHCCAALSTTCRSNTACSAASSRTSS